MFSMIFNNGTKFNKAAWHVNFAQANRRNTSLPFFKM